MLQTYSAADVAFNRYVALFPKASWEHLWTKRPNESEKTIFLTGGREVTFKSGNEFDNLRVETLNGCIIDECREQKKELWTQVIRPMLGRYKGWCDFYSTPKGFDWFYDLENEALASPDEWDLFNAPSTEAWWWTPEEILSAKRTMSEAEFAQEILAEFRDITSGKVYVSYSQKNLSAESPLSVDGRLHPMLGIIVAMDFNVGNMSWILGQKRSNKFHWFEELVITGTHTQEQADQLAFLVGKLNHKPGVILVGDASGKANKTSAVGNTDYDIICKTLDKHKIPWINMTPDSNPNIKDRVNTVNASLMDASGEVNMTFDPIKCPTLKRDFERVVWKKSTTSDRIVEDQTKDQSLTHISSAVGYAVCALNPMGRDDKIPTTRILAR